MSARGAYTYPYPRPALTVDCAIFTVNEDALEVLLIRRGAPPFAGQLALPGGFVEEDETVEQAALRELFEETGVSDVYLEQLHTFSRPDRDPRGRVVSVAHLALVRRGTTPLAAGTDASDALWVPVAEARALAFDHDEILAMALARLRRDITWQPLAFHLLPERFTLRELQRVHEVILGHTLDKRNFRKKILGYDVLIELDETQSGVPHRAARLYRVDEGRCRELLLRGEFQL